MLASTIQFTTNPPTPTTPPHNSEAEPQARQPGRTTPEPRQHATPTRTQARTGTPTTTQTRQQRACLLHQTPGNQPPQPPPHRQETRAPASHPAFRESNHPTGPDPSTAQARSTAGKPPPHAPSTQGGTHHHQTQAAEGVSPIPTRTSQPHPREPTHETRPAAHLSARASPRPAQTHSTA